MIIMCAAIPWAFQHNRQQELALRLSARRPILYIEPPTRAARNQRKDLLLQVAPRVYVLPSQSALPGDRLSGTINTMIQRRLAGIIKVELKKLNADCDLLWIDRIQSQALVDYFPRAAVVYDCVDEEWSFGRSCNRRYLHNLERRLLERADVVFASSGSIYKRLAQYTDRAALVPNGCDFDHFAQPATYFSRPADLPDVAAPIIGFVGCITRRSMDWRLLEVACRALPNCQFVFVGWTDASAHNFAKQHVNVLLIGSKPYAELPAYLAAFDVAIIPYVVGGSIDYVYPKKLHEYLAAGKPVVVTDLPELRQFRHIVKIATNSDEFVRHIESCLIENADAQLSSSLIAQRRALACENTWEKRVARINEILDAALSSPAELKLKEVTTVSV
jgi:glycosyltransferase involved in cell wall biosynthesis